MPALSGWPCLCYVGRHGKNRHRPPRHGRLRRAAAGFTLAELIVVCALIAVGVAITIPVTQQMVNRAKNDSASVVLLTFLDGARDRAVAERRNIELTFQPPNRLLLERIEVPSLPGPIVGAAAARSGAALHALHQPGIPDTPDAFGGAARSYVFTGDAPVMFTSDGSLIDSAGDVTNGTIFFGVPNHPEIGAGDHRVRRHRHAAHLEVGRRVMDAVSQVHGPRRGAGDERGFSFVEVIVAMFILTAGLLPLVALFTMGVQRMTASTPMLMAREKAREAIESVHAARDTGEASWATIHNTADGGVFLTRPAADQASRQRRPGQHQRRRRRSKCRLAEFTREIDINPPELRRHRHREPQPARGARHRPLQGLRRLARLRRWSPMFRPTRKRAVYPMQPTSTHAPPVLGRRLLAARALVTHGASSR